jgi:hypothetical protein
LRRAVGIVVLFSLMISALSLSASAQSQNTFYLHTSYLLDQNGPTGTTTNALKLATGEYYVWKSASFSTQLSFTAGTWTAAVWMNMTQGPTQYRLRLGTVNIYGAFAEYAHSFTPIITSVSPARYEVSISGGVLNVPAGDSLAMGFLGQWQNGSYSPAAFILFDSQAMPSSMTGPAVATSASTSTETTSASTSTETTSASTSTETTSASTSTQTTTQQMTTATTETTTMAGGTTTMAGGTTTMAGGTTTMAGCTTTMAGGTTTMAGGTTTMAGSSLGTGWAFALIGIGIGVACAGGGVAAALGGRQYPQVFTYDGYYYCMKHRVPVWYVQGHLWCPVERRYLRS